MLDALIYLLPFIVGGLISGILFGLLPFVIALRRRRFWLGFFALVICTACGAILGAILAFPVAVSFSVAILLSKKVPPKSSAVRSSHGGASPSQFSESAESEPKLDEPIG
ncbi:MAG: hypothetical protein AAFU53_13905 [Cyanobacteria bacterium J06632_3]